MSAIIMIHGFGATSAQWKFLVEQLDTHGLPIHTVDLIGHGSGMKPPQPGEYSVEKTFEKLVQDIHALTEEKVILIGHSLGGLLSMLYAYQQPERVERMVLINPLFTKDQVGPGLRFLALLGKTVFGKRDHFPTRLTGYGYQISKITHPAFSEDVRTTIFDEVNQVTPKVLYMMDSFMDITEYIPEIRTPALLIWGDRDSTLDPVMYPHLAELLGPERIEIFENEDHSPHLTQSEQVGKIISEYIR